MHKKDFALNNREPLLVSEALVIVMF